MTHVAVGPDHPRVSNTELVLAAVFMRLGKRDSALDNAKRALAVRERAYGTQHPDVAEALAWLGRIRSSITWPIRSGWRWRDSPLLAHCGIRAAIARGRASSRWLLRKGSF
jgi:hypothetical protein